MEATEIFGDLTETVVLFTIIFIFIVANSLYKNVALRAFFKDTFKALSNELNTIFHLANANSYFKDLYKNISTGASSFYLYLKNKFNRK